MTMTKTMKTAPLGPTRPEIAAEISALYAKSADRMAYLDARWLDERLYEDFAEYAAEMKKLLPDDRFTFVSASKRPFGFTFSIEGRTYFIGMKGRGLYVWTRVA
jgi:hypothetical protein